MKKVDMEKGINQLETLERLGHSHGLETSDIEYLIRRALEGWREARSLHEQVIKNLVTITRMNEATLENVPEDIRNEYLQNCELACMADVFIQKLVDRLGGNEEETAKTVWEYLPSLLNSVKM